MPKDYKDRGEHRSRKRASSKNDGKRGRWLLIAGLMLLFIIFLVYLKTSVPKNTSLSTAASTPSGKLALPLAKPGDATKAAEIIDKKVPSEPKFDYYTILPEAESTVPDHEIKTRLREELVGKAKTTQYTLQAGAFRKFKDADRLKAQLALMGIASKIEKAKVGEVVWNRVKLGPYDKLAGVDKVKSRLKKSGIDVLITEAPN